MKKSPLSSEAAALGARWTFLVLGLGAFLSTRLWSVLRVLWPRSDRDGIQLQQSYGLHCTNSPHCSFLVLRSLKLPLQPFQ